MGENSGRTHNPLGCRFESYLPSLLTRIFDPENAGFLLPHRPIDPKTSLT